MREFGDWRGEGLFREFVARRGGGLGSKPRGSARVGAQRPCVRDLERAVARTRRAWGAGFLVYGFPFFCVSLFPCFCISVFLVLRLCGVRCICYLA